MDMKKSLAVIAAVAAGGLAACGGSSSSSGGSSGGSGAPYIGALALVVPAGTSISPVQVQVCTDSTCATPISTATVTVNGASVPWNASKQDYEGATAVALGQPASLSVTYGGKTYTASGTQFTAPPTITSPLNPAGPASWNGAQANDVAWTGGAPTGSGADYIFGIMDGSGKVVYPAPSGTSHHGPMEMAMGTMSMSVPANALPNGTYSLLVGIATVGAVSENGGGVAITGAASGSGLWLGAIASPVNVTISGSSTGTGPVILATALYRPSSRGGGVGDVQVCTDMTCATPVTTAAVTMNGVTLPWDAGAQLYQANLSLPLGGAVDVSVTLSGTTYSANGTMFTAPPTVSAPASGATWIASASNPVILTGGAPLGGADYTVRILSGATGAPVYFPGPSGVLEVPTTASPTATVAAGGLASGSYNALGAIVTPGFSNHSSPGYSFGTAAGTGSGLWLGAASDLTPFTVSGATSGAPYITALVIAQPTGSPLPVDGVQVCTDSTCTTSLSTATVAVNGSALSWNASRNQYEGSVAVASGGTVTVTVAYGGTTYTASGTQFTSAPTITAPASGASWSASAAHTISWTGGGPTSGAVYVVGVMGSTGGMVFPTGSNGPEEVSTSTFSATVPAGTLASGNQYLTLVGIGTPGISTEQTGGIAFSPTAAAGSGLWLGSLNLASVTATP